MQFNSLSFLIFLPTVFLLYWCVLRSRRQQNLLVVMASYVFYGWWDWRFLSLILLTTLLSYGSGRLTERYSQQRELKRAVCAGNVVANLLILCTFKYYDFFAESLASLLGLLGWHVDWVTLNLVLPVGISFYTFQALSYTIDVYRGTIRATHDVVEFMAYISFFPQLVAGPIERASHLLPQFQTSRSFSYEQAADGCRQMLWGFFKKMVVADNCAMVVNQVWANYQEEPALVLLVGAVLFTFQIYGDFSGYSDIAVGCARLFGFRLMRNFDYPYFARNIQSFWRRWHISLTTWLRDYVYIPLGGSRGTQAQTLRNILVVWAVSGLWHGARWTFVCWGLYHGLLLIAQRQLRWQLPSRPTAVLSGVGTFFLVVIGWVIFRSETMGEAIGYLSRMADPAQLAVGTNLLRLQSLLPSWLLPIGAIAVMTLCEWRHRRDQHPLQVDADSLLRRSSVLRYGVYVSLAMLTIALAGSQSEFIYFQF